MSDTIGLFHGKNSNFGFEVEPPTRSIGEKKLFFNYITKGKVIFEILV